MDNQAKSIVEHRRKHGRLQRIVALLSAIVMLLTMNSLKMDADTLERVPTCGLEEHEHTDACYTKQLVCGQEEKEPVVESKRVFTANFAPHVHTADCLDDNGALACGYVANMYVHEHSKACYDGSRRVCGLEERPDHRHTDACWKDISTLMCTLEEKPGHTHSDTCYIEERILSCGEEVSEGHKHTEVCYGEERTLSCGKEESQGHVHNGDCYTEHTELTCTRSESDGHKHNGDCYSKKLVCGLAEDEEHTHSDSCYENVLTCGKSEGEGAHHHGQDCYTTSKELSCGKSEGEGAHHHTEECYTVEQKLVCGLDEGAGAHQHTDDCYIIERKLACGMDEEEGHTHTDACYSHTRELVCGKDLAINAAKELGLESVRLHTHSDKCFYYVTRRINGEDRVLRFAGCGYWEVPYFTATQADWATVTETVSEGHTHTDACYQLSEEPVCGLEEHTHTDACYQERPAEGASDSEDEIVTDETVEEPSGNEDEITAVENTDGALDNEDEGATDDVPEEAIENEDAADGDPNGVSSVANENITIEALEDASWPVDATVKYAVLDAGNEAEALVQEHFAAGTPVVKKAKAFKAAPALTSLSSTGYKTFDISLLTAAEEAVETGKVRVTVRPENVDVRESIPKEARILDTRYTLCHVHEGEVEEIGVDVVEQDGIVESFTFETESFSYFVLCYTVTYTIDEEADTATIHLDFTDFEAGEACEDGSFIELLNDGVSIDLASLMRNASAPEGISSEQKLTVNVDGSLEDEIAYDEYAPAASDDGISYESGLLRIRGNGAIAITDGNRNINIVVTGYKELLCWLLEGDNVSVDVLDGAVPAGSAVAYEQYSQEETDLLVREYLASRTEQLEEDESIVTAADASDTVNSITGHAAFDVSIIQPEGDLYASEGSFCVHVVPDLGLEAMLPEDAVIQNVSYKVYHIHDGQAQELEVTEEEGQLVFTTECFSDFVVEYTVDFTFTIGEETYTYTLPGGGVVSIRELVDTLHVYEGKAANADAFIGEIASIAFSNEELMRVLPVTDTCTVAALKQLWDLDTIVTDRLSIEERAAFDAQVLTTPDWALVSIKPFDTEEQLTITLQDGSIVTIAVTDAQISRDVMTASGETFTITVVYDETAGIPEDADLFAEEILPGTDAYTKYLAGAAEGTGVSKNNISFARFFDIAIMSAGEAFEPLAPVEVRIAYKDGVEMNASQHLSVVHFTEESTEIIDDVSVSGNNSLFCYMQSSFSVTGTIVSNAPVAGQTRQYMILVQYGDKYYLVNNDATLTEVPYSNGTVSVTDPMMWTVEGYNPNRHIYFNTEATGFNENQTASDFYRRYLNSSEDDALTEENASNVTIEKTGEWWSNEANKMVDINHVSDRSNIESQTALDFYNDHLFTTPWQSDRHFGVELDANGVPVRLIGNQSGNDGVRFVFAEAQSVPDVEYRNHTVNHIDISISGISELDVPLAFGTYYYKDGDGNWQSFEVTEIKTLQLKQDDVRITPEDMKRATIRAYDKNGNELDNAYVVTGYSSNADTAYSTVQVRIEGKFKVADLNYSGGNEQGVMADRLNNKITYEVTATKPMEFPMEDEEHGQLYEKLSDGSYKPLSVTVDVNMSASFDYFDEDNECPPLQETVTGWHEVGWPGSNRWEYGEYHNGDYDLWRQGGIPTHNMSGMDFVLGGDANDANSKVVALEITKLIVNEQGKLIKPANSIVQTFDIYRSTPSDRNTPVAGLNVDGYERPASYDDYSKLHSKEVVVGPSGVGLVYDYAVMDGMYYIAEQHDAASLPRNIVDADGESWDYKETYILTEYVRRGDQYDDKEQYPDPMHYSKTYTEDDPTSNGAGTPEYASIPEVLGMFTTLTGEQKKSGFLEYFVYNVYTNGTKLDVEKIWEPAGQTPPEGAEVTVALQYRLRQIGNMVGGAIQELAQPGAWGETFENVSDNQGEDGLFDASIVNSLTLRESESSSENWKGVFEALPRTVTAPDGKVYEVDYNAVETSVRIPGEDGEMMDVLDRYNVTYQKDEPETEDDSYEGKVWITNKKGDLTFVKQWLNVDGQPMAAPRTSPAVVTAELFRTRTTTVEEEVPLKTVTIYGQASDYNNGNRVELWAGQVRSGSSLWFSIGANGTSAPEYTTDNGKTVSKDASKNQAITYSNGISKDPGNVYVLQNIDVDTVITATFPDGKVKSTGMGYYIVSMDASTNGSTSTNTEVEHETVTLNASNGWTYTLSADDMLPGWSYYIDASTAQETGVSADQYIFAPPTVSVDDQGNVTYTCTNQEREKVKVSVRKEWDPLPEASENARVVLELRRYARISKGTMSVTLLDNTGAPIAGAVYRLYVKDENSGEYTYTGVEITTDENGKANKTGLEPGTYKLIQETTPDEYTMNGSSCETEEFTVLDQVTAPQDQHTDLTNTRKETAGRVTLTVYPMGNGVIGDTGIAGAVFDLYKDGEIYKTGLTTNAQGQITETALGAGTYWFQQASAPDGYELYGDGKTGSFTVEELPGQDQPFTLTMYNWYESRGSITVVLTNADDDSRISGAQFELWKNGAKVATAQTNGNGALTFGDPAKLEPGTYTVKQITTSDGLAVAEDQTVVIEDNNDPDQRFTLEIGNAAPSVLYTLTFRSTSDNLSATYNYYSGTQVTIRFDNGNQWYNPYDGIRLSGDINGTISEGNRSFTVTMNGDKTVILHDTSNSNWGNVFTQSIQFDPYPVQAASLNAAKPASVRLTSHSSRASAARVPRLAAGNAVTHTDAVPASAPEADYIEDAAFTAQHIRATLSGNTWTYEFPGQDKYDANGDPYYYYVVEAECEPEDYWIDSYTNDPLNGNGTIVITNKREPKGDLVINKEVFKNSEKDASSAQVFRFAVYAAADTALSNALWTGSITGNGSVTVPDLVYGAYMVYELDADGQPITNGSAALGGRYYTVTGCGSTAQVSGDTPSVRIRNTYQTTSVDLTKTWDDEVDPSHRPDPDTFLSKVHLMVGENTITSSVPGYADMNTSIVDNENGTYTVTWSELPAKDTSGAAIQYTAIEDADLSEYYDAGTVTGSEGHFIVVNTRKTGEMSVRKTVAGNAADTAQDFSFTVTFAELPNLNGEYGRMTFNDGVATFTLRDGQSVTATGLPTGAAYTIVEEAVEGYITTVGETVTGTAEGTISDTPALTAYVNTKDTYGDIHIRKTVSGDSPDQDKEFSFTITVDPALTGVYGDAEFTDGTATLVLKASDAEARRITGLPNGTTYTIAEGSYTSDGYTQGTVTGSLTGTITGGVGENSVVEVSVDNVRAAGGLVVSKTTSGNAGEEERRFSFTVSLEPVRTGTYGDMTFNDDGIAEFTLANGESLTASDLPVGTRYTVVETDADQDGYVTTVTGTGEIGPDKSITGVIAQGEAASAAFENKKDTYGDLSLRKTVSGTEPDQDKEFSFTITVTPALTGTYGDAEFTEGTATLVLKASDAEAKRIIGLPNSTEYTIAEDDYSDAGYTQGTVTGDLTGTIEGGTGENSLIEVVVDNVRQVGSLKVIKQIQAGGQSQNAEEDTSFTVGLYKVTAVDGGGEAEEFVESKTIAVSAGSATGEVTFENLEIGAAYRVYELDGDEKLMPGSQAGTYTVSYDAQQTVQITLDDKDASETTITNDRELVDIDAEKIWHNSDDAAVSLNETLQNAEVTFTLCKKVGEGDWTPVSEQILTGVENWHAVWNDLDKYESGSLVAYKVTETAPKIGGSDIALPAVAEAQAEHFAEGVEGHDNPTAELSLINTLPDTSVSVRKVWQLSDTEHPDQVTVYLKANGETIATKSLSEENNWSYAWPAEGGHLPKFDAAGREIAYTVEEEVLERYTAIVVNGNDVDPAAEHPFTIVNSKAWIEISGEKAMLGGEPPAEGAYTFQLEGLNGAPMPDSADNGVSTCTNDQEQGRGFAFPAIWYTQADLPDGETETTFTYKVTELPETSASDVSVRFDFSEYTVTVTLKIEDNELRASALTTKGDAPADAIRFENEELTTAFVQKEWKNAQGNQPPEGAAIELNVFALPDLDTPVGSATLNGEADEEPQGEEIAGYEDTPWHATWINLPKYEDGEEIQYVIKEAKFQDYAVGYNNGEALYAPNDGTITNTQETIIITGQKTWVDGGDARPESLTLELYEILEGEGETATVEAISEAPQTEDPNGAYYVEWEIPDEGNTWSYVISNVPRYKTDGTTPIRYRVAEDTPSGYRTEQDWSDGKAIGEQTGAVTGADFTNTELTELSLEKYWELDGNPLQAADVAEDSITIHLYRKNGTTEEIGTDLKAYAVTETGGVASSDAEAWTIAKADDWKRTISGLDKYYLEEGTVKPYRYYISEDVPENWSLKVYGASAALDENGVKKEGRQTSVNGSQLEVNEGTVDITNSKFSVSLPHTGGIGTNIFRATGGALLLLAALWLAMKRRHLGDN